MERSPAEGVVVCALAAALTASIAAAAKHQEKPAQGPTLVVQTGHVNHAVNQVDVVVFSADSRLLASGDKAGAILLWDVESGRQLWTLPAHVDPITALSFSPDGRWLASSSAGSLQGPFEVRLWDVATGRQTRRLEGHEDRVLNLAFSRDGRLLATAADKVRLWSSDTGARVAATELDVDSHVSIAFSPDGRTLAIRQPSELRLVRIGPGEPSPGAVLRLGNFYGRSPVAFSADGRRVATIDGDVLRVWNPADGQSVAVVPTGIAHLLGISADGREFAVHVRDRLEVWDATTNGRSRTLATALDSLSVLSPDWMRYTSRQRGGSIAINRTAPSGEPTLLEARVPAAGAIAFDPNGTRLATVAGRRFWIWPLDGGEPTAYGGHDAKWPRVEIDLLAFLPDNRTFISADFTGRIIQRNLRTAETEPPIEVPSGKSTVTFDISPDGRRLVAASVGRVALFDLPEWRIARTMASGPQRDVAISPNGQFVAAASVNTEPKARPPGIDLWDVRGTLQRSLVGHEDSVTRIVFDSASRRLASGDLSGAVKIWDVASGGITKTLAPLTPDPTWSLAFSPDGRLLAVGCERSICVWDLGSDRRVHVLNGHTNGVVQLKFSPDGKLLASSSADGSTRLWDVESGRELIQLFALESSNEWLIVAPDGQFDGSPAARKQLVAWRVAGASHPAERYASELFTPGLLASRLSRGANTKPQK